MSPTPAEIFRRSPDAEAFVRAVRGLNGDFPFDAEAMADLGRAYFERHPDSASERDLAAVGLGYALVRACAVERLVRGMAPGGRDFYRAVFEAPAKSRGLVEARRAAGETLDALRAELAAASAELDAVRAEIERIPKGMIKERFVGGISLLSNGLFLVRTWIDRLGA